MKSYQFGLFAVLAGAAVLVGCSPTEQKTAEGGAAPTDAAAANTIRIEGSNTVQPIAQVWKEGFNKQNPNVNITLGGAGTGTGFKSLADGTADICNASRPIKDDEKANLASKGITPVETRVALDGLAVAVNAGNPVKQLTVAQLRDIYLGKVTNWNQVGGAPGTIALFSRDASSGTHDYFKEHVLNDAEFAKGTLFQTSTQAEVAELAQNRNAIAYGGVAYFSGKPGIKVVPIVPEGKTEGVEPTEENIRSGAYPLARPLFVYTKGEPTGLVKQFIDFGLSAEGQALVRQAGYVPLK